MNTTKPDGPCPFCSEPCYIVARKITPDNIDHALLLCPQCGYVTAKSYARYYSDAPKEGVKP